MRENLLDKNTKIEFTENVLFLTWPTILCGDPYNVRFISDVNYTDRNNLHYNISSFLG